MWEGYNGKDSFGSWRYGLGSWQKAFILWMWRGGSPDLQEPGLPPWELLLEWGEMGPDWSVRVLEQESGPGAWL